MEREEDEHGNSTGFYCRDAAERRENDDIGGVVCGVAEAARADRVY
jgi:hypothetical protein